MLWKDLYVIILVSLKDDKHFGSLGGWKVITPEPFIGAISELNHDIHNFHYYLDDAVNTYTCSTTSEPVKVGVSRIWVSNDNR